MKRVLRIDFRIHRCVWTRLAIPFPQFAAVPSRERCAVSCCKLSATEAGSEIGSVKCPWLLLSLRHLPLAAKGIISSNSVILGLTASTLHGIVLGTGLNYTCHLVSVCLIPYKEFTSMVLLGKVSQRFILYTRITKCG